MKRKIKSLFKSNPTLKLKSKEIAKKINAVNRHEYAKLKETLFRLTNEEFLIKIGKRYQLNQTATGKLRGTFYLGESYKYGFVVPEGRKGKDIFIPEKYFNTAFDQDVVEVRILAQKKGKNLEGEIIKIIERKRSEVIGTLHKSKNIYFVAPDENSVHKDLFIPKDKLKGAKDGDKVVVQNIYWDTPQRSPQGEIVEILGRAGTYDIEIAALARDFGIPYKFPKAVLKQAKSIPVKIDPEEIKKRLDLRDENIFTIDPEDAKDFDDAVSVKTNKNGNYIVGIHIADVSHFIPEGTPIFKEAFKRGNSTYFVGRAIPMLPEKLSNNICSLVPNKDRLTFSVIVELSPRMKIVNYSIAKSIIRSKRRFTYKEAQKVIETGKGDFAKELLLLNAIAKKLKNKRRARGSIDFIRPEVEFTLDKEGKPIDVKIKKIAESNNLIEELMLLANKIIAEHVNKNKKKYPFIYRVHDLPEREKIIEFANFVKSLGYKLNFKNTFTTKALQELLDKVKETEEEALINEVAIRSMAKAVYSTENIGHFGLGFKYYTHFTSPIRRFPDLIVHKLIFNHTESLPAPFSSEQLNEIAEHSSETERNSVKAERLSIKLKQMEFLRGKLGDDFSAVISGVTSFGMFVQLVDTLADGMVKLRDMEDDFYIYDEKNYALIGKHNGKKFRLGDRVKVKLIRIDEERREIDFILL